VEQVADLFGIEGALTRHSVVERDVLELDTSCLRPGSTQCLPVSDAQGGHWGPYCSRGFAGVCYDCYVPGTTIKAPLPDWTPFCPYNVLNSSDYRTLPAPSCKSQRASDACCLYTGTCMGSDDPAAATLDLDGLRLVAHRCWREGNSTSMLVFAKRWAKQKLDRKLDVKSAVSQDFAYGQWSFAPGRQTVADFEAALNATSAAPAPTPSPSESGGFLSQVVAIPAFLAVAAIGGLGFRLYRGQQEEEEVALLGTSQEGASV